MKTLKIKSWTAVFLAVFLLGTLLSPSARAESGDETDGKIRVAFPQIEGLTETDSYGRRTGMVVDYLNEIAKYTGWEYEYVDVDKDAVVDDFLQGRFDLMGGTFYLPSLEEYFLYPDYSMGSSRATLLCRKDDGRIKSYDLRSIEHMTIGVYVNASEKIRRLQDYLMIQGLECTLKYYTYEDMKGKENLYEYLENGEVDLLLGNDLDKDSAFRTITSFDAQEYYIVADPQRQDLIDGINMAMEKILESEPDFEQRRYEKNYPDTQVIEFQLNPEEQEYIREKQTVTVAVMDHWHPFYCISSEQEHHQGLVPDLLDKISEETGLQFVYLPVQNYQEAIEMVQTGRADLLGSFLGGEDDALDEGLALSRSYAGMNMMIVRNKAITYPGDNLTGAIVAGKRMPSEITAANVRYYDTVQDGIRAVEQGEADFMYGLATSMELEIQRYRFLNIVPVTITGGSIDISFALARPIQPQLLTILNKVIGSLTQEEQEELLNRNMVSIGSTAMSLKDMVYAYPIAFIAIITVFVLLAAGIFMIIVRSRMKNALMKTELEKAEAQSRAKGEFLSRMSHEIRTPMNAIVGLADLTCMMEKVPEPVEENLRKIQASSQYLLSLINDILDMSRIDKGMMTIVPEPFSMKELIGELQDMMEIQAGQKQLTFTLDCQIRHDMLSGDALRLRQVLVNLLSNAFKFTPAGGGVTLKIEETDDDGGSASYSFLVRDTGIGVAPENQESIFEAFEQVGPNQSKSEGTGLGLPISRNIVRLMGGELRLESTVGKGSEFGFVLRFPLETASAVSQKKELPAGELKGIRILLAEDNELNAQIAMEMLKMQGAETDWALNGQEAVERFEKSAEGYYQVILMDIQMPVKNGLQATEEIRASSRADAREVAIIAMTANSFASDMQQAQEAGMNGFVPKPVDLQKLCGAITAGLRRH